MLITCLKELEERGELKTQDIIEFTIEKQIIKYHVCNCCLFDHINNNVHDNDKIFRLLKIDKYDIATKAYGYKSLAGVWPTSRTDDYPALTRLVAELYKIIEKKEPVYTKFTRFEIMEI